MLTDLLTTDLDNYGCSWTRPPPPSAPVSRSVGQLRTDLDSWNLATDQMIGRCGEELAPCPPRARKEGQPRRFTVSHGATGSVLDLWRRRSAGRVHLLCKQVFGTDSSGDSNANEHKPLSTSRLRPGWLC